MGRKKRRQLSHSLYMPSNTEPTSGLEPLTCSLRMITYALQGCAQGCKCCISRGVSFLRLAECCARGGIRVVSTASSFLSNAIVHL
jgi:hypothetical protein